LWVGLLVLFFLSLCGISQTPQNNQIRELVQSLKKDIRGPYQAIRWFCPDGSVLPPQERCPEPGGIQHALHKDVVQQIARERGIYLGQILAGTPLELFWDETNRNSRLKQYQMEQFLQAADDGWILRRARYYRGAIQAEDEADRGARFLTSLTGNEKILRTQFFLIRQAAKDIPHGGNDDLWQNIRAVSKTIGDSLPVFTDLRVKLHGQPDAGDLARLKEFRTRNKDSIPPEMEPLLDELENDLEKAYLPFDIRSLDRYLALLPPASPLTMQIKRLVDTYSGISNVSGDLATQCKDIAELIWNIRKHLLSIPSPQTRLSLIDLSNEMEGLLFRNVGSWNPETRRELLEKTYFLAKTAAGAGYIEIWEWEAMEPVLYPSSVRTGILLENFLRKADYASRVVEWGTAMIRAEYEPVVTLFGGFEPLSYGFIDDRVRSSILLPLGNVAGQLKEMAAEMSGVNNQVMGIKNQNRIRGVNPGFAKGELSVISGSIEDIEFSSQKIYLLRRSPSDLTPVAGIATVAEGNLVSHVQLLARNLGIPNAVLSLENLADLAPFSGQTVFYAVSPGGKVIMKPETAMTAEEKALFRQRKRSEEKVAVSVEKIRLSYRKFISLRELRAKDSGHLVGPKDGNCAQRIPATW
jgi:hypothetical protein